METYTQLIKELQNLNQEIRRKHSSMHLCTEQEMKSLAKWLEEIRQMEKELENISSVISLHLNLLEIEFKEQQTKNISKD